MPPQPSRNGTRRSKDVNGFPSLPPVLPVVSILQILKSFFKFCCFDISMADAIGQKARREKGYLKFQVARIEVIAG